MSSGLGINSVIEKSGTSNGKILDSSNQTDTTTNQTNIVKSTMEYLNSVFGSSFSENQLINRLEGFFVNLVYILDGLPEAILITTLISLGLGLYPAWFVSKLKVEEALLCEY